MWVETTVGERKPPVGKDLLVLNRARKICSGQWDGKRFHAYRFDSSGGLDGPFVPGMFTHWAGFPKIPGDDESPSLSQFY
jgi:hypothetical protein